MDVPYFQVPNTIFCVNLTKYELLALVYLCRCNNNGKTAFPSYKTIAKNCSISRNKAIDAIRSLERKELIRVTRRPGNGKNNSNLYAAVRYAF